MKFRPTTSRRYRVCPRALHAAVIGASSSANDCQGCVSGSVQEQENPIPTYLP